MGVPSSPGQAPPRIGSHSTGVYFGTGLIASVSCLLVLWGLVTAIVLGGAPDRVGWLVPAAHGHRVPAESAVATGAGLVVVFAAVILMGRFASRVRQDAESVVLSEAILAVPAGSTRPQPALLAAAQLNLRVPEAPSMAAAVSGPESTPDGEDGPWL